MPPPCLTRQPAERQRITDPLAVSQLGPMNWLDIQYDLFGEDQDHAAKDHHVDQNQNRNHQPVPDVQ
jgi:hypothetical protein